LRSASVETVTICPPAPPVVPPFVAAQPYRLKSGVPPVEVNVAMTVLLALITIVAGFAVPARSPLQPENTKPAAGVAVSVTTLPEA
jgi:hypothetical protein